VATGKARDPGKNSTHRRTRLPPSGIGYHLFVSSGAPARKRPAYLRPVKGGGRPGPTDEELIEAVRTGDHRLAHELYERLFSVVDHTLYRVFGRREPDHDDLVQAAFEQIVVTLSRRSFARACSLRTWASTVTSHVALNALRSRRRERKVVDRSTELRSDLGAAHDNPEHETDARRMLDAVRDELAQMKPDRATAVFLHDVLGHELAEIALMQEITVAAAQSRLVRGRKELERRLQSAKKRGGTR